LKSNFRLRLFSLFSFFILFLLCFNLTNLISGEQARSTSFPASDPVIFSCSVLPTKVQPGDLMTVSAVVFDFPGIEKVEACFSHELGFDTVYLSLVIGSSHLGVWRGQWLVHDTKIKEYSTQVTAFSRSGLSSSKDLSWWDPVSWWNLNWEYRKLITLSSSQVPSDLSNFPVLISITDTDLRDDAQSDGDDIAFTDSSGNQLNHEIESYTSGTGNLVAWVNITSLSSSSDTEIYMYYGNSGCTSQQNAENTWDSNFVMIQHFQETDIDGGAGDIKDSTSYNNDGSSSGLDTNDQVAGKIDGSFYFDGSADYVLIPATSDLDVEDLTISSWNYVDNYDSNMLYQKIL